MQLVGATCVACRSRVVSIAGALECPSCHGALHATCVRVEEARRSCPACAAPLAERTEERIFARDCLICGLSNPDRKSACSECRSRLSWDSAEELDAYKTELRRNISPMMSRGAGAIALGAILIGWPIADVIQAKVFGFGWMGFGVTLGCVLMIGGIVALLRARRMSTRLGAPIDWWKPPGA